MMVFLACVALWRPLVSDPPLRRPRARVKFRGGGNPRVDELFAPHDLVEETENELCDM